jgi:non-ribosomal peptide synthetase component F/acyl carrier protein
VSEGRTDRAILAAAARAPAALAVAVGDHRLSYGELVARARAIAAALVGGGLAIGDRVLLDPARDLDAFPAMLGFWLAGGVLVPLPAAAPTPQVQAIRQDAAPRALVGSSAVAAALGAEGLLVVATDQLGHAAGATAADSAPPRACEDAYILYTSGTTGRPKGVVGDHAALHQYLDWQATEFANDATERFSQIAPLAFDFALKEILVPLIRGASVWIVPEALRLDGHALLHWLDRNAITSACCMPLVFRELTAALASLPAAERAAALLALRRLHVSGDMLYWHDVERWQQACGRNAGPDGRSLAGPDVGSDAGPDAGPDVGSDVGSDRPRGVELVNMYGPTESTIIKASYRIPPAPGARPGASSDAVPVGRPIAEAAFHVLTPDGAPSPPGELGEVVLASPWLARGYTDPELTAQRFVTAPGGGRAYRTGDLGRLSPDGLLSLAGRADRQVKINGVRVELAGIETILRPHAEDLAVVAPAVGGDRELVCCFTAADPTAAEQALRAAAARELAPAEIPRRFLGLPALPRTHNGKVDRDQLLQLAAAPSAPAASAPSATAPATAPTGDPQQLLEQMYALWADVLRVDAIADDANFFELGGDSMKAISLLRAVRQTFQVRLRLADLLDDMTPRGICRRIQQQQQP